MLVAMGWVSIQASYKVYSGVDPSSDECDDLDEYLENKNALLREAFEKWLKANADTWFRWEDVSNNNHDGYYQVFTSRNHDSSVLWKMMDFIAEQSKGSHGLIYAHDDETLDGKEAMEYRVWRILDGRVTEHSDPFFSHFASLHAFGDLHR